ncbi:MAG: hypothetical protein RL077_3808 [Verrucomicrobiota bacterium]
MSIDSSQPQKKKRQPKIGGIIGVGLDNEDGHKRLTSGDKFVLIGGSQDTHDRMTETMIKTFEELKRRDKPIEKVDPRELAEIIDKSKPR